METPMDPRSGLLPQDGADRRRALPQEFDGGAEVVDLLDAAALIESRGYSDRSVRSTYGYDSVFDLARDVLVGQARRRSSERQTPSALSVRRAWMRAALLISGAVLAGIVQAQLGAGSLEMIMAGCAGWVLGQAVAGITWYRLRFNSIDRAAHDGGVVAMVCAALAFVMSLVLLIAGLLSATGFGLVLGWVAYALSVSLLTVMDRVRLPLVVMGIAVFLQSTVWASGGSWGVFAVMPATVAIVVIVVHTVRAVRAGDEAAVLELSDLRGILVPVTQAVLLAGALVVALAVVPESHGTAFVATAVLAVAVTDPGIVTLRGRLSWFAHRSTSLLWSRWFAWGLASLSILFIAAVSAGLVLVIVAVIGAQEEQLPSTVMGAVLFSVFATLSSVLTAFGAQVKGLVPAALAVLVMLVVGSLAGGFVVVVSGLACIAGLSLLIHQFSDARVFA